MRLCLGLILAFAAALGAAYPTVAHEAAPVSAEYDELGAAASPLDGLEQAGVRARLGDPTLARAEGAGAFWTYRLADCALFVYFADQGNGLRVTGAAAGPRRHGEPTPEVSVCIAQAERSRVRAISGGVQSPQS